MSEKINLSADKCPVCEGALYATDHWIYHSHPCCKHFESAAKRAARIVGVSLRKDNEVYGCLLVICDATVEEKSA